MYGKTVKLQGVGEIKQLTQIASKCPFTVSAVSGHTTIDAASILASLGLDVTRPVTLVYDGESEALETFIREHAWRTRG